jgi:hypothetical protein
MSVIDENSDDYSDPKSEFEKACIDLLKSLKNDYTNKRNQIHELMKLHKSSQKIKRGNTGFTVNKPVPAKLIELLGYEKDAQVPRSKVIRDIHNELKKRNLILSTNKRVYRSDAAFRKTFGLSKSVNDSTDEHDENGFNFFNLQKHVKLCYDNDIDIQNERGHKQIIFT